MITMRVLSGKGAHRGLLGSRRGQLALLCLFFVLDVGSKLFIIVSIFIFYVLCIFLYVSIFYSKNFENLILTNFVIMKVISIHCKKIENIKPALKENCNSQASMFSG